MPRSKESSDELRRKVVEAHEAGKGYKTIAKVYDLHRSTVRQIIYKWRVFNTTATRPRSGRPTKLDTILRLMGSGTGTITSDHGGDGEHTADIPGSENDAAAEDVCGSSEGEETNPRSGKDGSAQVSGSDTSPESANAAVHTDVGEGAKTAPKRRRSRVQKTNDSKAKRSRLLQSTATPSSSRASSTPTPAPAEHHAEDILCCEICGACFSTEPALEVHQAQHLYKMLHECDECGKAFQSAAGLKTHKKRKHGC